MRALNSTGSGILTVFFLAACGSDSGPTTENSVASVATASVAKTAAHFSETIPVVETVINPCNGETVNFSGTVFIQGGQVSSDGPLHSELHARVRQTGIGEETGVTYTLRATFHEIFESPTGPALNSTVGATDRGFVQSSDASLSFRWLYAFHAIVQPDGDVMITRLVEAEYDVPVYECAG